MANFRRLVTELSHPLFLSLDGAGMLAFLGTVYAHSQWQPFLITLGSSFITIGITVPVAVFFQSIQSEQAFRILNACNRAGIESVYVSRKQESVAINRAVTAALSESQETSFLGVAFREFFDSSGESREALNNALYSLDKKIKVGLLDPESAAAFERQSAECGNKTIEDIRSTMNYGLVAVAIERIRKLEKRHPGRDFLEDNCSRELFELLNFEVRTYKSEPVAQVMKFDSSLFCEQYHRGRPSEIVPAKSCIGKYMPVVEYRRGSYGYRFMEAHLDHVWNEAGDETETIIRSAQATLRLLCEQDRSDRTQSGLR